MDNIMEISHLYKSFGEVKAVQDLNFCVKKGELFAFLGVNGAGKSTTINIMCGELRKDSGSVRICGADLDREPDSIRRKTAGLSRGTPLAAPKAPSTQKPGRLPSGKSLPPAPPAGPSPRPKRTSPPAGAGHEPDSASAFPRRRFFSLFIIPTLSGA